MLLHQSQTVGEHGIGELHGTGQGFATVALNAASVRAWRLVQVCIPGMGWIFYSHPAYVLT